MDPLTAIAAATLGVAIAGDTRPVWPKWIVIAEWDDGTQLVRVTKPNYAASLLDHQSAATGFPFVTIRSIREGQYLIFALLEDGDTISSVAVLRPSWGRTKANWVDQVKLASITQLPLSTIQIDRWLWFLFRYLRFTYGQAKDILSREGYLPYRADPHNIDRWETATKKTRPLLLKAIDTYTDIANNKNRDRVYERATTLMHRTFRALTKLDRSGPSAQRLSRRHADRVVFCAGSDTHMACLTLTMPLGAKHTDQVTWVAEGLQGSAEVPYIEGPDGALRAAGIIASPEDLSVLAKERSRAGSPDRVLIDARAQRTLGNPPSVLLSLDDFLVPYR